MTSIQLLSALSTWDHCRSSLSAPKKKAPEKDFIALNRLAAQSGLTSAHEQTQFRACNDIRRRSEDEERMKQKSQQQFPEDMVFGISTRFGFNKMTSIVLIHWCHY